MDSLQNKLGALAECVVAEKYRVWAWLEATPDWIPSSPLFSATPTSSRPWFAGLDVFLRGKDRPVNVFMLEEDSTRAFEIEGGR